MRAGRPAAPLDSTRPASRAEGAPAGGPRARRGLPVPAHTRLPSQPSGTARPGETRRKVLGGGPCRGASRARGGGGAAAAGQARATARGGAAFFLSSPPAPSLRRGEKRGVPSVWERGSCGVRAPVPARPPLSRPAPVRRRAAFSRREGGRPEPRLSSRAQRRAAEGNPGPRAKEDEVVAADVGRAPAGGRSPAGGSRGRHPRGALKVVSLTPGPGT